MEMARRHLRCSQRRGRGGGGGRKTRHTRVVRAGAQAQYRGRESGHGGGGGEMAKQFAARVAARGDEMIGSILADVSNTCFFEEMRANVSGTDEDVVAAREARAAALDDAIAQRMDKLDDGFLLALEAYIGACERAASYASGGGIGGGGGSTSGVAQPPASADQMIGLLETLYAIREKVVAHVRESLPSEVRAIEFLIMIRDAAERENTMAFALDMDAVFDATRAYARECPRVGDADGDAAGGITGGASVSGSYEATTDDATREEKSKKKSARKRGAEDRAQRVLSGLNSMIGDMESTRDVPDVRVLAQLVLLRDVIRRHVVDEGLMSGVDAVSRQEMAFMKELLAVADVSKRRAILRGAFGEGEGMRLPRSGNPAGARDEGSNDKGGTEGEFGAPDEAELTSLRRMFESQLARRETQDVDDAVVREGRRLEQERERDVGVRPGRFFDAARLLEAELKLEGIRFGPQPPPEDAAKDAARSAMSQDTGYEHLLARARKNTMLTRRLADVLADARAVLDIVAGYTNANDSVAAV